MKGYILKTQLQKYMIERGKEMYTLESELLDQKYDTVLRGTVRFSGINYFRNRIAPTKAMMATVKEDLAVKSQIIKILGRSSLICLDVVQIVWYSCL